MGAYSFCFSTGCPRLQPVNTAGDLAGKYAKASSGFINAILEKYFPAKAEIDSRTLSPVRFRRIYR
jgi:transcription termination factor NusB